jgi:hypothetical protein
MAVDPHDPIVGAALPRFFCHRFTQMNTDVLGTESNLLVGRGAVLHACFF